MVKLGIIVFANDSGLGNQTRRLSYMLKPFRVLVINSKSFSKNKKQNIGWYEQFHGYTVDGFPTNKEIEVFLRGLTHVLLAENPLNFSLLTQANRRGIKTYIQSNYEFCDHLANTSLTLPTKFLMPSYWMIDDMVERFGTERVEYLPPPIDPSEFAAARFVNFGRTGKKRFLHVVGTLAASDRNGTLDLIKSLLFTQSDFELTITSQHDLPLNYITADSRVSYHIGNRDNAEDLYKNYDALILPRRYGGLSLTCNEAMMSGMMVVMTDISPNNQLLPKEWCIKSVQKGELMTRVPIQLHNALPKEIAKKIDWLCDTDLNAMKTESFDIAHKTFAPSSLSSKYEALFT